MQPVRRIAEIAKHERAKKAVKTGSDVFGVIKNVAAIGAVAASLAGGYFATQNKVGTPRTCRARGPCAQSFAPPACRGAARKYGSGR